MRDLSVRTFLCFSLMLVYSGSSLGTTSLDDGEEWIALFCIVFSLTQGSGYNLNLSSELSSELENNAWLHVDFHLNDEPLDETTDTVGNLDLDQVSLIEKL